MADILFCSFYILVFTFIIVKSPFFRLPHFKGIHTLLVFYLKLVFGVVLWYIYAHHYKNRITSDIFKYFDDSKVIYHTLRTNFADFLKLISGIDDANPAIKHYYMQMNCWLNSHDSTLYNNSHFIIRLNALFMILSGGHYGVHVIFMCFLSLIGLTFIYKSFYPYLQDKPIGLFAAVFLFPSVLLWGSGVLKEGLVLLGLGISIYYFGNILTKQGNKLKNILLILLGILLIFENKGYVLICILPCFISEYLISVFDYSKKHPLVTYGIVTLLYLRIGLNAGYVNPKLDPIYMIATKQREFNEVNRGGIFLTSKEDNNLIAYLPVKDTQAIHPFDKYADSILRNEGMQYLASGSFCNLEKATHHPAYFTIQKGVSYQLIRPDSKDSARTIGNDSLLYMMYFYNEPAKSAIKITPIKPSILGLIEDIPNALNISVLRPFPKEIHAATLLIYAGENLLIVLFIMLALFFFKRESPYKNKIAFCMVYCLLMLILIGLVTPVYGGIERYKAVVITFLLILLLLIYDKEKAKRFFKIKDKPTI